MHLPNCILISILLMIAYVSGSDESIYASVGEDVTLNCSVDSHFTREHIEEVSWKKTDKDEHILVLLYQNNKTLSDSAHERYRDRVEFFTPEIPKGNFSLRLKSVRTEDKGVYMCQVFAGGLSINTTVVLERLGFSVSHIMVLILCISASGSTLLLCWLIYCRSPNKGFTTKHSCNMFVPLGGSVVLPCHVEEYLLNQNLMVEWRRVDKVTLVHLYQDCKRCSVGEFDPLVVCLGSSVVLPCYGDKRLLKKGLKVEWRRADSGSLVHLYQDGGSRLEEQHNDYLDRAHFFTDHIRYGNFSLRLDNLRAEDAGEYICKIYSDQDCVYSEITKVVLGFVLEHSSQTLVPLGSSVVLPCYDDKHLKEKCLKVEWRRADSETLVHLYQDGESRAEAQQQDYRDRAHFFTNESKNGNFSLRLDNMRAEDEGQYTCTIYSQENSVFSAKTHLVLRLLVFAKLIGKLNERAFVIFSALAGISFNVLPSFQFILLYYTFGSTRGDIYRVVPVYVFGSVGVVLLNAVALMTELILKTVNGYRTVEDLRIIVFSSEFFFPLFLLILLKAAQSYLTPASHSLKKQTSQNAAESDETPASESKQKQDTAESHEMKPFLNQQNQDAGRSQTQPDSVETQS
ncbi:Butyrophilin-like protein 2 [Labeo rohita]|uniref:Butyrophilin-like protein 2 n=1 Tax=Labeo rohita TaxID=84645 RepID=A0ABQ8MVZ6_LABRO|nr:Butyrophilin-like protein 2 [Labeo rohita]